MIMNKRKHLGKRIISITLAAVLVLFSVVPAGAATGTPTNSDGAINSDGNINSDGEAKSNANSRMSTFAVSGRSTTSSGSSMSKLTKGWHSVGGYRYYFYATGKYYTGKMVNISGSKYLFDQKGHLLYGINTYRESRYYSDSKGTVKTTAGFISYGGYRYYVQSGGVIVTGKTFKVSGKTYKAYSNGKLGTGVFKYGKVAHFYADSKGVVRLTPGFIKYKGYYYYITKKSGRLEVGRTFKVKGKTYKAYNNGKLGTGVFKYGKVAHFYANSKGVVRLTPGFIKYNGYNYYITKEKGRLEVGRTFKVKGKTYKAYKNGKLGTGVFLYGTTARFYANSKGEVKTTAGFVTYKGKRYYVQKGSRIILNKKFTVGKNKYVAFSDGHLGTYVFKKGSKYYYADSNGVLNAKAAVKKYNSNYYYAQSDGTILTSKTLTVGSKKYFAGSNGVLQNGFFTVSGQKYYASKGAVSTKKGFISVSGGVYYIQDGGTLCYGKTFKVDGKTYKAYGTGKLGTGLFKYGSYYYYADNAGAVKTTAGLIKVSGKQYYVQSGGKIAMNTAITVSGKTYKANSTGVLTITATTGAALMKIAQAEVGTKTGKKYWTAYFGTAFKNGDSTPWCGTFVTWCFKKAGLYNLIKDIENYGNLGYVPSYTAYANKKKLWVSTSTAKAGDIIIFGSSSHVGLVKSVVGNVITTIEGNTGTTKNGEVKQKTYSLSNSWIKGVIRVIKS